MLDLILGAKGKGKTRTLVDRANNESKITNGSVLYIDKDNKHMYELSNVIRLINLNDYDINSVEAFFGFIQGIISSNHSITHIFLDNFRVLSSIKEETLEDTLREMDRISDKYNVLFVISTSTPEDQIPEEFKKYISCVL